MDQSESTEKTEIHEVSSLNVDGETHEISRQGRNILIFSHENYTNIRIKGISGVITDIDDPNTVMRRVRMMDRISDVLSTDIAHLSKTGSVVPITVAAEGKPMLACYLYAFNGWKDSRIAQLLDIQPRTVEQYLTDILNGRR